MKMKLLIRIKNMILAQQRELGHQGLYTLKFSKGAAQQLVDEISELEPKPIEAGWVWHIKEGEFRIYWQYQDGSGELSPTVILPIVNLERTKAEAIFITASLNMRDKAKQEKPLDQNR